MIGGCRREAGDCQRTSQSEARTPEVQRLEDVSLSGTSRRFGKSLCDFVALSSIALSEVTG